MSIYLTVKRGMRHTDYLFVDDVSVSCYENALFRVSFKHDTLKKEQVAVVDEYLNTALNNFLEILNGSDESSEYSGTHEDRIKALEEEIVTLTNNLNSQATIYGVLKITPHASGVDFLNEGTVLKFTNKDGGVYTSGILEDDEELEIILPIGEYKINIVNMLDDSLDCIFSESTEPLFESTDDGYTMDGVIAEGIFEWNISVEYESGD